MKEDANRFDGKFCKPAELDRLCSMDDCKSCEVIMKNGAIFYLCFEHEVYMSVGNDGPFEECDESTCKDARHHSYENTTIFMCYEHKCCFPSNKSLTENEDPVEKELMEASLPADLFSEPYQPFVSHPVAVAPNPMKCTDCANPRVGSSYCLECQEKAKRLCGYAKD